MSDKNTDIVLARKISSKDMQGRMDYEKQVEELLPDFYSVSGKLIALLYHGYRYRVDYYFDEDTIGAVSNFPAYLQGRFDLSKSTAYAYTRIAKTLIILGDDNAKKILNSDMQGHVSFLHKISRIRNPKEHKAEIMKLDTSLVDALLAEQNKKAKKLYQTIRKINGLKIIVDSRKPQFTVAIEDVEDMELAFDQIEMLLEQHKDYEDSIITLDDYSVESVESESNVSKPPELEHDASDAIEDGRDDQDEEVTDLESKEPEGGISDVESAEGIGEQEVLEEEPKLPEGATVKSYSVPDGKQRSMLKKHRKEQVS